MQNLADDLFQIARDNYKLYSLDLKNRQTTIQNIYFWIASTLFTLYAAVFHGMFTNTGYIHLGLAEIEPAGLLKLVVFTAFGLCVYVVLTGVDDMRGRGTGEHLVLGRFTPATMLDYYLTLPTGSEIKAMRHLLEEIENNAHANALRCQAVGRHLRRTSRALICAILCGLFAFIF